LGQVIEGRKLAAFDISATDRDAMRLIHLSDIHFTAGDIFDPDEDQREELLSDVGDLVDAGGAVNGILIGGDIAFSGARSEYVVAAQWIERVRARSGCPDGAIWVVPGNHDIDRNLHRKNRARTSMVAELRETDLPLIDPRLRGWLNCGNGMLNCLEAYNNFSEDWVPPTTAANPHWTDLTLDLAGLDVCLTGLNSVLASDSRDRPPPLLILGTQQCSLQRAPNRVHIAFAHHPPTWIRDWPNVAAYLRRAHLVLFGHEHRFRIEQATPGLTVTVYAGAVGPDRPGPDPAPVDGTDLENEDAEYLPSWNLIEITRDADELVISIEPRVWDSDGTGFVGHDEAIHTRHVRLDLKPIDGAVATGESRGHAPGPMIHPEGNVEHPGSNSSPLIPGSTEVQSGMPLPSPVERSALRALAVWFMRQTPTRRLHIADQLGVSDGLAELELSSSEEGREILRRVRVANKINELRGLIDA
jgi:hypothetical protein